MLSINSATVKLTVSIKRRLGSGDEVFIAPGIELHCAPDELDAKQAEVTDRVNSWMETLLAAYPDPADADEGETDDETEDADEDEAEDADEDEEGEDLTEEEIDGMDKKALLALIKEQEVEIDGASKMGVKDLREAVKEALFAEADEDEDADEDGDDEDEDAEGEDEGAGYTEAELKPMKLEELQDICTDWGIGNPKLAKGADLKTKKAAYIKHILANQEVEE